MDLTVNADNSIKSQQQLINMKKRNDFHELN